MNGGQFPVHVPGSFGGPSSADCNQEAGTIPSKTMTTTSRKIGYTLIVGAFIFASVAAHADFNPVRDVGNAAQSVGGAVAKVVTPPHVNVQVDPKKPLTPVRVELQTPVGSAKVEPSPVPAPPEVHANGNGFIANAVNTVNDAVQKPKNWIDQKGREINGGFIHLGNEIGMFWANLKHDIEKKVGDWIHWLKEQAQTYGIYALAGIGASFLARGFFWFLFGRRSRNKFAGYHA